EQSLITLVLSSANSFAVPSQHTTTFFPGMQPLLPSEELLTWGGPLGAASPRISQDFHFVPAVSDYASVPSWKTIYFFLQGRPSTAWCCGCALTHLALRTSKTPCHRPRRRSNIPS